MPRITPNLWFDTQGLEAAEFYCSVFPNSQVDEITHYGESDPRPGEVLTVNFELDGQPFTAINGGPEFPFSEAISLLVDCADQDEIDHYWEQLTDRRRGGPVRLAQGPVRPVVAGVSGRVGGDADQPEPEGADRAMQAMYGMKKLDLAALQAAFDGAWPSEEEGRSGAGRGWPACAGTSPSSAGSSLPRRRRRSRRPPTSSSARSRA